jgi:hypothetical protein
MMRPGFIIKKPITRMGFLIPAFARTSFNLGNVLLSHTVTHAVPSALKGLTSVFGMGTGVSPSLWSPRNFYYSISIEIWMKGKYRIISIMVKPIDLLVSVCSIPCGTYTSDLSTS